MTERLRWILIVAIALLLSGAWLVSTRYSVECVQGSERRAPGAPASGVYCYVLDGWTGEVRPGSARR